MNYEQIKQAAFVDELEKIALSEELLERAKLKAGMRLAGSDTVEQANKAKRQMHLFSGREHDIRMKKLNASIDDDLLKGLERFKNKLPGSFKSITKYVKG